MSYLISHLINRINDVKIRIKQLYKLLEKCTSKRLYNEIENELNYNKSLLDELTLIYQLALEEV